MKRVFDIGIIMLSFIFLIPICLIISALIKLTSKGPILYWSDRVGKNNVIFKMPKFRTMYVDAPVLPKHLMIHPQQYLTPVGSFLRQTSLDEIPQLWSVLRGDMSFVGPRPALANQEDLIVLRTQLNVHTLTPGLTGWAQINGRDSLSTAEKVSKDKEYADKYSFLFDVYIFLRTFEKLFLKKDISH